MGIYYDNLLDIMADAGVQTGVNSQNAGWESRARSSGGFSSTPKGIVWHHTASKTSIENDLSWQCHGCDDAPVGNMTIARDGVVWPVAAGASNCAGKGGPANFSRGQVALDSGNTGCWNIEVANNGVGEAWPVAQIDAYFKASNALNAHFGNQPDDVITHNAWAPTRKIDPATAEAVQGPWVPTRSTSSGTWNLDDIKNECVARASGGPGPMPPQEDDDMGTPATAWTNNGRLDQFVIGTNDHLLYHRGFTYEDGWTEWELLPGEWDGSPSVTIRPDDQGIYVFARGRYGDIFQMTFEWGIGWTGPIPLGPVPGA
jgi:N-acetylmuramoyl-L-alanine amidase